MANATAIAERHATRKPAARFALTPVAWLSGNPPKGAGSPRPSAF